MKKPSRKQFNNLAEGLIFWALLTISIVLLIAHLWA